MKKIEIKCSGTEFISFNKLTDFQKNLKSITKINLKKLKKQIIVNGFIAPIFIWKDGEVNNIIDGHGRLKALNSFYKEGYEIPDIPIVLIEADNEEDARKKLLSITSQYGDFNLEELQGWLVKVDEDIADSLRFFDKELNFELTEEKETIGDDEVNEEVEPVTKLGDLWELGGHRVLCGDSTDKETVKKLMDGKKADMVFTDPPYGVSFIGVKGTMYIGGKKVGKDTAKEIIGDSLRDEELSDLFFNSIGNAIENTTKDTPFYIFFGINKSKETLDAIVKLNLTVRNWLIWDKGNVGFHCMGAQYKPNYESFLYCHKNKAKVNWCGDQNQQTIWRHPLERLGLHSTGKPVNLMVQAIKNHSTGLILDIFLGSGSTLIACEKTNRTCYGLEIDPYYTDVTVNRYKTWCEANGKIPEVKLNGEPWEADNGQT